MSTLTLRNGDCVEVMRTLADGSVGAIVSDPPYGLRFMGKAFDDLGDGASQREWHRGWITEAYRVLRPGGVFKAFGGTRTFHHLGAVMRETGFTGLRIESWSYGSGFPKSHSISKALDKTAGVKGLSSYTGPNHLNSVYGAGMGGGITTDPYQSASDMARTWEGWGTALKPSWEPVVVGRKPE